MKSKIIGALVAAAALTTGCATEQAAPQCLVGAGDFVVKYYPKDDAAAQCGFAGGTRGEILSLQRYLPTDTAPATLGVRLPAYLGDRIPYAARSRNADGSVAYNYYADPPGTQGIDLHWAPPANLNADATLNKHWQRAWRSGLSRATNLGSEEVSLAVAQFDESDAPDADNFCRVSDFGFEVEAGPAFAPTADPANFIEIPTNNTEEAVEDGAPETIWVLAPDYVEEQLQGEQEASYAFKNVEFYVTTRSQGVTFRGDLTFSQTTEGGETCTGEFAVVGLAPSFGGANTCASDADCDPCGYGPDGSYVGGTGIIPDLDVVCDPDLYGGFCFLRDGADGQPPELPAFIDDDALAEFNERCAANQRGEG